MPSSPSENPGPALAGSLPRSPFPWRGWLAGILVVGVLVFSYVGTQVDLREMARGMPDMGEFLRKLLPTQDKPWHARYIPEIRKGLLETIRIALGATFIGAALALPYTLISTRPLAPARWVYNVGRGLLNLMRTIPDLVLAALLVAILGAGALPGLVALTFFTFGVVTKLLSDTVETADPGPMEAITAAGGTRLQRALFAMLPQVGPDFVAFTLYAFEINIRVAAVLGLVGAGGIGQTLMQDIQLLRYGRVGMIIATMFVVVLAIDSLSTWLRSKLV